MFDEDGLVVLSSDDELLDLLREFRWSFDYRLREGVVDHGNALQLMRSLGLDV